MASFLIFISATTGALAAFLAASALAHRLTMGRVSPRPKSRHDAARALETGILSALRNLNYRAANLKE